MRRGAVNNFATNLERLLVDSVKEDMREEKIHTALPSPAKHAGSTHPWESRRQIDKTWPKSARFYKEARRKEHTL
jgi:hypothetical protein